VDGPRGGPGRRPTVPVLELTGFLLGAAAGTAVVLTRNPVNQAIVASFYGLVLGIMFLVYQAPDVALSQITVGAVALPLMILLALAKVRALEGSRRRDDDR
jgi:energy-converting hydrogenase B subunit D